MNKPKQIKEVDRANEMKEIFDKLNEIISAINWLLTTQPEEPTIYCDTCGTGYHIRGAIGCPNCYIRKIKL